MSKNPAYMSASGIRHPASGMWKPASGTRHQVPGIRMPGT
ncbi:hypothetical protein B8V81_0457 [Paenibacillus pasadenensis]|uniref:Uncharacterized protein n=1 Tax=Paenibacillus pasadenensis TaxID=217090 RepID=A0A2N5NDA2_9BACL|nr:hypothetical protein B8V81_0457 [Paenibacillus pasadenensis]